MFEIFKKGFEKALHTIRGHNKITESNIHDAVKEIRKALINADVNYKIAKDLTEQIKNEALGVNVLTSLHPEQVFTKIVYDKLVEIMSCGENKITYSTTPKTIILLVGLQGAGKTTLAAKMAKYCKNIDKKKPLLVACDIYRPAAIEQLTILAENNGLDIFKLENENNIVKIIQEALKYSKENNNNVIIIDTAGRQTLDGNMMQELENIKTNFHIDETILVLDSMIGQISLSIANEFNECIPISGFALTKMDGDTQGGVALSVTTLTHKPIKFISTGEKIDDIEFFYADRIANRILGKGDVVTLVEKIEQQFAKEESNDYIKNLQKGRINYNDILMIQEKINNMGGLMKIFDFIPGFNKIDDTQKQAGSQKIAKMKIVINSMTPKERKDLCRFDLNRKMRIAKGCGMMIKDVEEVISTYDRIKNMIGKINNNTISSLLFNK